MWANVDGTETVKVHGEPIHFQPDGGEAWERIDNRLVPDGERPGWVRNAANGWMVRFGPIGPGGGGGVELVTDAGPARFAPQTAATADAVAPVVGTGDDADTVTYRDVWPGVDVVYTVSGSRVKEDIVVGSRGRFEFPFVVEGLGLTTTDAVRQGAVLVASGAQANQVAVIAPEVIGAGGRLVDSEADPSLRVDPAATGPSPTAGADAGSGAQVLSVAVDGSWLSGLASDELPVVVDPTVVLTESYHSSYKSDGTVFSQDGLRVGNPLDAAGCGGLRPRSGSGGMSTASRSSTPRWA